MSTPKLPPLPKPKGRLWTYDPSGTGKYKDCYTEEQMQAYAIAAIEAQGVPDVVQEWKSGVISAQEAMLKIASSPPAPQASVLNQSDMPEDMAKVLRENAWDLYATGERASVVQQEPVAWWKPEFENPLVSVGPKQPLLYPDARPLYTHPAPQAKPLSDDQREVLAFLCGEGALEGGWFGDNHHTKQGNYWWRKNLRRVFGYGTKE